MSKVRVSKADKDNKGCRSKKTNENNRVTYVENPDIAKNLHRARFIDSNFFPVVINEEFEQKEFVIDIRYFSEGADSSSIIHFIEPLMPAVIVNGI